MNRNLYKIISASFLVLALSACAEIDQSLYSASNAVAPADRVTGRRTLNITSRQAQIQKSNQWGDQLIKEYTDAGKPINEKLDPDQYQRLLNIFGKIHSVSHLRNEKWTAFLLPDKEWNAFTMGGTYIFVYQGIMNDLKNDDELAAVIGHEIAHVTANHVYEQNSYKLAAKLNGSKSVKKESFQAAFTLKDEEEADQIGLMYAALAGYDPYAAPTLWKRMYDNEGDFSAMTIDHPINSQRYKKTLDLAEKYKQYYIPNKINPDNVAILDTNEVFGSNANPVLQAGQGGGLLAALEATSEVLLKNREVKAEQKRQAQDQQFLAYVAKAIAVTKKEVYQDNTLRVYFTYRGTIPIKNLNMIANIGEETATDHTPDIVPPNAHMIAEFKFKTVDLATINPRNVPVIVGHAERP